MLFESGGWALAVLVAIALHEWAGLSTVVCVVLVAAWVAKDFVIYPRVRDAYRGEGRTPMEDLLHSTGVVVKPLRPAGLVRLGSELWRAEPAAPGREIPRVRRGVGGDVRPGIVVSIATAGDLVQWHPHLHLLTTDGGKTAGGPWKPLPEWDGLLLMRLFREHLLARLVESHAISQELVCRLLSWRHPGFSAHVGEPIEPENKQHLEDTAAYLVRNPLSLKKLVYLDGERAVIYRSRMNPSLGRNFEAMDPLEWLARLSDHIPDPRQHRTLFYGEYSSRVRGCGEPTKPAAEVGEEHKPRRRTSPSWGRLIAKIYHVDPLVCTRCGKRMGVVAFVTDSAAIGKILDHLGLTNPEAEKPPPSRHERLRVAEHGDGWGVPQEWE